MQSRHCRISRTYHLAKTSSRDDIPSVNQTVQVAGGLLDGLAHFIIAVDVEHVRDKVERVLIILNLGIQTCEIEPVGQVFLVDFAKVLVASGGDELFVDSVSQSSLSLVRMLRHENSIKNAFVG